MNAQKSLCEWENPAHVRQPDRNRRMRERDQIYGRLHQSPLHLPCGPGACPHSKKSSSRDLPLIFAIIPVGGDGEKLGQNWSNTKAATAAADGRVRQLRLCRGRGWSGRLC